MKWWVPKTSFVAQFAAKLACLGLIPECLGSGFANAGAGVTVCHGLQNRSDNSINVPGKAVNLAFANQGRLMP